MTSLVTPSLYRSLTTLGAPVIAGFLAWRRLRGKEDGARFSERMGVSAAPRPQGALIWVHAASVGEAQSALILVDRILEIDPGFKVIVTTGTVTSARLMAERLPERAIHQYAPVDRELWVRRFLDHWRPALALWIESELWPNLVLETARRRIPMLLINGRMSERSLAGWRRFPALIRPLLASFARILAQSEADAARFRALGAREVITTGSLKFDAAPLPADADQLRRLEISLAGRPRWLAASTHTGEEAQIAAAHRAIERSHPGLVTIIVPRHPDRGAEIAGELDLLGLTVARRAIGDGIAPDTDVYLADTLGELGLFYRLAPIAFVGGSLVPHGGQNLLEPARLGCVVLHGPHVQNFRAIAAELAASGACQAVPDATALADVVDGLLRDEAECCRRARAAKRATEAGRGALEVVIAALGPELARLGRSERRFARA